MLQEIVILPERFLLNCKTSDYILSDITRFVCMSKTQSMAHPITNGYSVGMLQEIVILPERFLLNCKTSDYILSDITRFVCMSKTQSMAHRRLDTFKSSVIGRR